MPDIIKIPFANDTVDKTIPQADTSENIMNLPQGFPPIFATTVDDGGKPVGRKDINGVLNLISQHTVHLEKGGTYTFNPDLAPYKKDDILWCQSITAFVQSTKNNNNDDFIVDPEFLKTSWLPINGNLNTEFIHSEYDPTFTYVLNMKVMHKGNMWQRTFDSSTGIEPVIENAGWEVSNSIYINNDDTKKIIRIGHRNYGTEDSIAIGNNTEPHTNSIVIGNDTIGYNDGIAIGHNSKNDSPSSRCISIGYQSETQGSNSIAIGQTSTASDNGNAFGTNTTATGIYSLAIGRNARALQTNATAIGHEAGANMVIANEEIQLGTTQEVFAIKYSTRSDIRDKYDINNCTLGLDFIKKLRSVSFKYDFRESYVTRDINDELIQHQRDGSRKHLRSHYGFIAQEIQEIITDIGIDFGGLTDTKVNNPHIKEDRLSLAYDQFIAPIVKAIQELSAKNDELLKRIEILEGK